MSGPAIQSKTSPHEWESPSTTGYKESLFGGEWYSRDIEVGARNLHSYVWQEVPTIEGTKYTECLQEIKWMSHISEPVDDGIVLVYHRIFRAYERVWGECLGLVRESKIIQNYLLE